MSAEASNALTRIAAYEARVRPTLLTALLRLIGGTRAFSWVYRHIGPPLDRWLMHRAPSLTGLYGLPALLLTTTGARSGLPRVSPLR